MKTVSFFLRNFATIDHHSPYIYFLENSGKCKVHLVFTELTYNYKSNKLIEYFLKKNNITIIDLPGLYFQKNKLKHIIYKLAQNISEIPYLTFLNKIYRKVFFLLKNDFEIFLKNYYSNYIKFNMNGIFDYSKSDSINYAKNLVYKKNGQCINLAHWVWMWSNELRLDNMLEFNKEENILGHFDPRDLCIFENKQAQDRFNKIGVAIEKSYLYGSARFTKEWIETREQIIKEKKYETEYKNNSIKILFFYPKQGQNIHNDELIRTVSILSQHDDFEVILKLHDRVNKLDVKKSLPKVVSNKKNIRIISNNYSSSSLISWCDVVLNVHSSVMFEATIKDKTLILLTYLHSNKMWFEDLSGFWKLSTRDDLVRCLNHLEKDKLYKPYTNDEKEKFLETINKKNQNIIDDYINLAIH